MLTTHLEESRFPFCDIKVAFLEEGGLGGGTFFLQKEGPSPRNTYITPVKRSSAVYIWPRQARISFVQG